MIKAEVEERHDTNDIVKRQETNSCFTGHTIDMKIKVEENENIKVEFMESEESSILSFEHNCRMIKAEADERDDANDIVKRQETNSNFTGHTIDMKINVEKNEDIKVEPKDFEIDDLVEREDILIPKKCSLFMENYNIKTQVESKQEGEENPIASTSVIGLLEKQEKEEENDIDVKYEALDYGTERFIENAECDLKNKFKDNLKLHFKPSHEKEESPRFAYELCSYEALRKPDLKKHMAVQTCILCEASFEHKYQLDAHYVSAHSNQMNEFKHLLASRVYQCFNCSYASVYLTDFKNHLLMHENDPLKLQGYIYDEVDTLKKKKRPYRRKSISTKIHQCPKCSLKTLNITYFKYHLLKHEKSKDRFIFECRECDYKSRTYFKTHLRLHKCTKCNKKFNAKRDLDRHILFRHKENEQLMKTITSKVHQCLKCSFETISITYFKSHLLKHEKNEVSEGRFKFKCDECDHKFINRRSFNTHLRLHTGHLPLHKCTGCNKEFNRKVQLDQHILSRHKENEQLMKTITNKIHQCHKCSYETTNITDLKKHLAKRHEEASNSLY